MFQNVTPNAGTWLSVEVQQTGDNRFAIGAHVELRQGTRVWTQERTVGGGHAGGALVPMHFGLGDNDEAVEVTVIWPDGEKTVQKVTTFDQVLTVVR